MTDFIVFAIVLGALVFLAALARGDDPPRGPYGFA